MDKEEIIFNPELPYAHYEKGHEIFINYKNSITFATVMSIVAFIIGFICVKLSPAAMAVFFGTAVPFTLLAIIGCCSRIPKMCLFSVPLGLVAGISAVASGSYFSVLGLIAYVIAAFMTFRSANAISDIMALKSLPGFPIFDASLDDISFVIMDEIGTEEFIDESVIHEEIRGKRFIAPMEPSDDMGEIITAGMAVAEEENLLNAYEREVANEINDVPDDLRDEVAMSLGHLAPNLAEYEKAAVEERTENSDRAYEKMVMLQQGRNKKDISDVDLLG